MPKISVVIPHYPLSNYLDDLLDKCIASLSGYDELILVINDGIGYGKAFNKGFKYTKGDYIIAVSNDTQLLAGKLEDMCVEYAVTMSEDAQFGCFFGMPRWVYEKLGGFDERFEGAYFEDNDFLMRLQEADIPLKKILGVKVSHIGGVTVQAMGKEQEYSQKNKQRFEEKWTK